MALWPLSSLASCACVESRSSTCPPQPANGQQMLTSNAIAASRWATADNLIIDPLAAALQFLRPIHSRLRAEKTRECARLHSLVLHLNPSTTASVSECTTRQCQAANRVTCRSASRPVQSASEDSHEPMDGAGTWLHCVDPGVQRGCKPECGRCRRRRLTGWLDACRWRRGQCRKRSRGRVRKQARRKPARFGHRRDRNGWNFRHLVAARRLRYSIA